MRRGVNIFRRLFTTGENIFDAVLIVLLLVSFAGYYFGDRAFFISALAVVSVVALLPVAASAWKFLLRKKASVDLLASVALMASFVALNFTSAGFINLMLTFARIFGRYTEGRAESAIRSLSKFRPSKANILRGGVTVSVHIKDVVHGDLVVATMGEFVPVDGLIMEGEATLDQSSLTGESLPVEKAGGDSVVASSIVSSGRIIISATRVGSETTLERIITLVKNAEKNKPGIVTFGDRFTQWYIIIVFTAAIGAFAWSGNINLALSMLLVVCADDIAVAVPLAFMAGISRAASRGIIVKGGSFLEELGRLRVLIVDKTGTLTFGKLSVAQMTSFAPRTEAELLHAASIITALSDHPTATAIKKHLASRGVLPILPDSFNQKSGRGATAEFAGKKYAMGKFVYINELGLARSKDDAKTIAEAEEHGGYNVTIIADEKGIVGYFSLADLLRPNAGEAIRNLRQAGVEKIIMLSGDNKVVAERVGKAVGVDEVYANLLPEDKVSFISEYMMANGKTGVAMLGDGVNDAAALSLAPVGIAMGAIGSDAAIDAANVVLMEDDLERVALAVEISRELEAITKQNFASWGISNIIGLALVFAGVIGPSGAALFNFLTDFVPIGNSLRMFKNKSSSALVLPSSVQK